MKQVLKWFATTIVVLVGLAFIGVVYQEIGTWNDARRFHQKGKSIQAGPVKLNIDCSGNRNDATTPEVILDSGFGVPAIGWFRVQPGVAMFTRVCSYDRAGYGWSDTGPEPRTSMEIARELKNLLTGAGEHGPYVLVGHSFGAFNVRVFTELYPADVAGVVLVDGSHEDEDKRMSQVLPPAVMEKENRNDQWNERMNKYVEPILAHLGIQRLQTIIGLGEGSENLPKTFRQELSYLRQQPKFRNALASEGGAFEESVTEVRAAGNLGDRPLVVLTAGKPYDPDPLLTAEQMSALNNLWINELQAQEAHLSTLGKQIVVPDSGHMIPYEEPDVVISAIHEVCAAAERIYVSGHRN